MSTDNFITPIEGIKGGRVENLPSALQHLDTTEAETREGRSTSQTQTVQKRVQQNRGKGSFPYLLRVRCAG